MVNHGGPEIYFVIDETNPRGVAPRTMEPRIPNFFLSLAQILLFTHRFQVLTVLPSPFLILFNKLC
jgi:hypothetical protein